MRFERDEIHPVLWKATDDLNNRWLMGQLSDVDAAVMPVHQRNWFKQYGRSIALSMVIPLAIMAAGITLKVSTGNSFGGFVVVLGLLGVIVQLVLQLTKNMRQVSSQELTDLLPALKLTGIAESYVRAVAAIGQANHLSRTEKSEILKGLCQVMDEHERIETARAALMTAKDLGDLKEEKRGLEEKIEDAEDPETRQNYAQALAILESRLAQSQSKQVAAGRLDAQAALLNQSLLQLTESLHLPAAAPAMPDLRDRLGVIQLHSQEVERAVAELDAAR
jgi:hypothetical protein